MTPNEQGSFCAKCCKTVVDFTTRTKEEIRAYLEAKSGQRVCGRLRPDQLTKRPLLSFRIRRFAAALWLVFGALLFTSCNTSTTSSKLSMRETEAVDSPKLQPPVDPQPELLGDIYVPPDTTQVPKHVKSTKSKKGKTCTTPVTQQPAIDSMPPIMGIMFPRNDSLDRPH